jgi:hypothetical protein
MSSHNKEALIAEEAFVIQHSGEIPEVTLHESLYHLTEDPDGPSLKLDKKDVLPLKQAVVKRYRTIILRDIDPQNRDKSIYRGVARCAANWQRLRKFCFRESLDITKIKTETAKALQVFLTREVVDVESKKRSSCINCRDIEIEDLAKSLDVSIANLPGRWQELCPEEEK